MDGCSPMTTIQLIETTTLIVATTRIAASTPVTPSGLSSGTAQEVSG